MDSPAGDSQPASKRLKVDTDEQVAQLFQASSAMQGHAIKQKRLVFKLIQQNKDGSQTVKVDALWKKFMAMPEKEAFEKGVPILESKQDLLRAINSLEADNCVMYSADDGTVVLI